MLLEGFNLLVQIFIFEFSNEKNDQPWLEVERDGIAAGERRVVRARNVRNIVDFKRLQYKPLRNKCENSIREKDISPGLPLQIPA